MGRRDVELIAKDLAPRIRVNAIAAGSTATSALEIVTTTPELKSMMEDLTPLHRIADPEEIAAGVIYLASPAGAFLAGKVLEIDGGTDIPSLDFGLRRGCGLCVLLADLLLNEGAANQLFEGPLGSENA